jgi:hypothetical protein
MLFLQYFPQFCRDLEEKLKKGFKEYGDISFSQNPEKLIKELQAECLDLAGWGLILWVRLEKMKEATNKIPGQSISPDVKVRFIGRSDGLDIYVDKEIDKALG